MIVLNMEVLYLLHGKREYLVLCIGAAMIIY